MNKEMQPTDENSAILSIALQKQIEAQHRKIYPTAEDIVGELNNKASHNVACPNSEAKK